MWFCLVVARSLRPSIADCFFSKLLVETTKAYDRSGTGYCRVRGGGTPYFTTGLEPLGRVLR